jgi:AmmeMemoRadiSam system protein B
MERKPAVADTFYTGNRERLLKQVAGFVEAAKVIAGNIGEAVAYVAPHAGYRYSGDTAGFAYKALAMKRDLKSIDTFVIVGPNHTGLGYPISISADNWRTPLGTVYNDVKLSEEIAKQSHRITIDEEAHRLEHSIEVQLPFLQEVVGRPKCCFICMGDQSLDYCIDLSSAISNGAKRLGRSVVVIASSDFNHYESATVAEGKDMPSLDELKKLRPEGFHRKIAEFNDSACGYGPITVSAMFARTNGAKEGVLLRYSNSGEVTDDYESVVAYASIAFV